jgi:hypothetical protein
MARTPAPTNAHLTHFIVDGSNIATEGRATPSLKQLNEAVIAFIEEHPSALITVVVDATFGHRIDKKEVKAFDDAVANNELVTPPAGAVGRGDAFVLSIAHKAKAGILSNDSFQEFHGDYGWLFEPGRLIGGKPVPHVGWVFVERLPVRGPKSRQAVKDAKQTARPAAAARVSARGTGSPLADQPMPVPTAPPPGPAKNRAKRQAVETAAVIAATAGGNGSQQPGRSSVNDLLPFLEFVERHPVGTGCTVVVESYASHGAYARAGDVLVYVPLRLMGDPPPRSARAALKIGEAVSVVIVGYVPERRSIDAALVSAGDVAARTPADVEAVEAPPATRRRSRAKASEATVGAEAALVEPVAEPVAEAAPKRRRVSKAKQTTAVEPPLDDEVAESPPAAAAELQPSATKSAPTKRSRRKAEPAERAEAAATYVSTAKPTRKRAAKRTDEPATAPVVETPVAPTTGRAKRAGSAKKAAASAQPDERPRKRAAKRVAKAATAKPRAAKPRAAKPKGDKGGAS